MVSHWSSSDSKSSKASRTRLIILADLNNTVISMVSIRPFISKFFGLCTNPLVTVPRAPVTIGINIIFIFHGFFISLARSRQSFFSLPLNFTLESTGTATSTIWQVLCLFCRLSVRLIVWLKLRDALYLKIPEMFVCLIFQDRCWVVHK